MPGERFGQDAYKPEPIDDEEEPVHKPEHDESGLPSEDKREGVND